MFLTKYFECESFNKQLLNKFFIFKVNEKYYFNIKYKI